MEKTGLIDRWIERMSDDAKSRKENTRKLLENLQEIYVEEVKLTRKLEAEANHLPYEHLTKEALKIVKEKGKAAEQMVTMVAQLGGEIDREEANDYTAFANGQFTEVLKMETALGERLVEELNAAEDTGFDDIAATFIELKDLHDKHQEEIERLIMKINAAL